MITRRGVRSTRATCGGWGNWGLRFQSVTRRRGTWRRTWNCCAPRPTVLRHRDYHPGNLIVHDGTLAGVVDFNRCGWGDPWEEFYKLAFFGAPLSQEYARGQIIGYFGGPPPGEFWPIYNLYLAMALFGDIAWTERNWPQYLQSSFDLIDRIAPAHDLENGGPPEWW